MKSVFSRLTAFLVMVVSVIACQKQADSYTTDNNTVTQVKPSRQVDFVLYTDQDFSTDNHTIVFNPYIKDSTNQIIWDSTFPAMKVKDIPKMANQILISKTITGYSNASLKVGFNYSLENVGYSWYIDFSKPGEAMKTVTFNFK